MFTGRPTRLRNVSYVGYGRYFLTFCTHHRRLHFSDAATVFQTLTHILRAAEQERFAVVAYCFMPDHLHLLVAGCSEQSDGRRFITLAKQFSGYAYSKSHNDRSGNDTPTNTCFGARTRRCPSPATSSRTRSVPDWRSARRSIRSLGRRSIPRRQSWRQPPGGPPEGGTTSAHNRQGRHLQTPT